MALVASEPMKIEYIRTQIGGWFSDETGDVDIQVEAGDELTEAQATVVLLDRISKQLKRIDENTA